MKSKSGGKRAIPEVRDLAVQVPLDLLKRVKVAAVMRDVTLKQLVTDALEAYLTKEGKK
jgi:hypothetical protein